MSRFFSDTASRFFRLAMLVFPFWRLLFQSIFFGISGHLSSIGLIVFSAISAAKLIRGESFPVVQVAAAVICGLVRGGLRYGEHYFGHDIAFRLLFDIRKKIFHAVNRLAPAKLLDRKSGDICQTVMSDVEFIETFFAHTLAPVVMALIVPLIILSVLGAINVLFPLVLFPFYLLMGLLVPFLSFKSASSAGKVYRSRVSSMNADLLENLQGLKELMLFNKEDERLSLLLKDVEESGESYRKIRNNEGWIAAFVEIIVISATAAIAVTAAYLSGTGLIDVADILIAVVISMVSFGPLISLMFLSNSLINTSAAAERVFTLIDEVPAVENESDPIFGFKADCAPEAVTIDFAYPGTGKLILKGFDLKVEKDKITVLNGESGRGKSTILYLMMRFFDPQKGKMLLGGSSLQRFGIDRLRSSISYFTQETVLFNISVMENLKLADGSASDEDVFRAAKSAGIHKFIMDLPYGYNTIAGEKGNRFSCGERQRLGLARIFLQDNEVILLDEPVSNLDHENEVLIMKNLRRGLSGRTVVLVSHRKSVVDLADRVVVI